MTIFFENPVMNIFFENRSVTDRDHFVMAARLKSYLVKTLRELVAVPLEELLENRYQKYRRMGVFLENDD